MRLTVQRFSSRSTSQSEIGRETESGAGPRNYCRTSQGGPVSTSSRKQLALDFTTIGVLAFSMGSVATLIRNLQAPIHNDAAIHHRRHSPDEGSDRVFLCGLEADC